VRTFPDAPATPAAYHPACCSWARFRRSAHPVKEGGPVPALRPVRRLPVLLALGLLLALPGLAARATQTATPLATPSGPSPALPPDATVGGLGLADWTVRWWQWSTSFPAALNPLTDTTGARCGYGQAGPVFFLGLPPAEVDPNAPVAATRSCTVPLGVALFAPVAVNTCDGVEPPPFFGADAAAQRACARKNIDQGFQLILTQGELTVDGRRVALAPYRVTTPQFPLSFPPGNLSGLPPAVATAVGDGFQALLAPLPAGAHVVTIGTPHRSGIFTVTYRLTVAAPATRPPATPAASPAASPGP
jgi:hypothetical protein